MNPEFWRKKRVFLTGHTGFKGSWLSLWLQCLGAEIVGYSLAPPTEPSLFEIAQVQKGMRNVQGDVTDLAHLSSVVADARPEFVFHLAAQSLVRESYALPIPTLATNIMGTAHVLESLRRVPSIRSVIVVTSDKCYENEENASFYRETDRLGGRDPYSGSKACAEIVTTAYRSSFFSSEALARRVGIATVRAGNVIGGGDWAADRLIPDAVRSIQEGKELQIRYPEAIRPWQHVLEPLHGYLALAEKLNAEPARYSGPWNFGPAKSDSVPVKQLLAGVQKYWNGRPLWRAEQEKHVHEMGYLRLDSSKAFEQLNWLPVWDLDSAIAATVAWYQAHLRGEDMRQFSASQISQYESRLSNAGLAHQ
jgi:CDP-glucose 4,6-dehydratase